MIANHIHDALAQVRRLQEVILDRRSFRGYSGIARMMGGFSTLAGCFILSFGGLPKTVSAHLAGWMIMLVVALLLNYGGLALWFFFDPEARRAPVMLRPALDALPPLAVGAVLAVALILKGQYDLLFGACMCLYGLVHVVYRRSLPVMNYRVGVFYMLAGAWCLIDPNVSFLNPWPMGLVFFGGEIAGGCVFISNRRREKGR